MNPWRVRVLRRKRGHLLGRMRVATTTREVLLGKLGRSLLLGWWEIIRAYELTRFKDLTDHRHASITRETCTLTPVEVKKMWESSPL